MKHRLERVNEVIKRELSEIISREVNFSAQTLVTLHAVDITLVYSRQFRDAIERNLAEAELLYRRAQATEDFEVLEAPPQLSIVPLRHAPPGAQGPRSADR